MFQLKHGGIKTGKITGGKLTTFSFFL